MIAFKVHFFEHHAAGRKYCGRGIISMGSPISAAVSRRLWRFDKAEDYIRFTFAELMCLFEHPVCLANSRGGADVDF